MSHPFIFSNKNKHGIKKNSREFSQLLSKTPSKWLLRKSTQDDSMLSLTFKKRNNEGEIVYAHARFALVSNEKGWSLIDDTMLAAYKKKYQNSDDRPNPKEHVSQLLTIVKQKLSLDIKSMLLPTAEEASSDHDYASYVVIKLDEKNYATFPQVFEPPSSVYGKELAFKN